MKEHFSFSLLLLLLPFFTRSASCAGWGDTGRDSFHSQQQPVNVTCSLLLDPRPPIFSSIDCRASYPVVAADGRVFCGKNKNAPVMTAFDPNTGSVLYSSPTPSSVSGPNSPSLLGSPLIDNTNGKIYWATDKLRAYNLASLNVIWEFEVTLSCFDTGGVALGPNLVYASDYQSNTVHALNVVNGIEVWNYTGEPSWHLQTTPLLVEAKNTLFISGGRVFALDATTGTLKWDYPPSIAPAESVREMSFSPSIDVLFVMGDKKVYSLNPNTGGVNWVVPFPEVYGLWAGPAISPSGAIYFGSNGGPSQQGRMYALDGMTGVKLWNTSTVFKSIETYIAVGYDGTVYVSGLEDLFAIDPVDGSVKWQDAMTDVYGIAISDDNRLYVTSATNFLSYQLCDIPSNSPSLSISASSTNTLTHSRTVSPSSSRSRSSSRSLSRSRSSSKTLTRSRSSSKSRSRTRSLSSSRSVSVTISGTFSRSSSVTVSPSFSASKSVSLSTTASISLSSSLTGTISFSPSQSAPPSNTPSNTASGSITPSNSASASYSPSISLSSSVTPTYSLSSSSTPSFSETASVSGTTSITPSNTLTPSISRSRISPSISHSRSVRNHTRKAAPTPPPSLINIDKLTDKEIEEFRQDIEGVSVDILPSEVIIKNSSRSFSLPIRIESAIVGELIIPENTFPVNCKVSASRSSRKQLEGENQKQLKCEDGGSCSKQNLDFATPVVEFSLNGSCGEQGDKKDFKNFLELKILGIITRKEEDPCFAFKDDYGEPWRCLEDFNSDRFGGERNFSLYRTKTDHFTSFAVLFAPDAFNQSPSDWLWITSVSMIGSAIVLVLFVASLYLYVPTFKSSMKGFQNKNSIDNLQKLLVQKSSPNLPSSGSDVFA